MQNNDLAVFSDLDDALNGVIVALGGYKKVGVRLRPELDANAEAAAQWLRDCLNSKKRERLNPHQVVMLLRAANEAGYHAAKHWLDSELGYEQGRPLDPRDEAARLQRAVIQAADDFRKTVERLERLTQAPLKAVS